jgi:MFS family permease
VAAVSRQSAIRFIVALGTISLFADVTYEGARSINGPFLGMLGASAAIIGIVSGAGELAGYLLRLFSGVAADRTRAYWTLTVLGYIINLLAVPCMALAGHWGVAAAFIILERAGKAIRTPARDVMLSQASTIVGRGWGFGLHEFMDQLGAFLGPLLVALVLAKSHQHYTRAYAVLALPAAFALISLFTAMKFYPDPSRFEEPKAAGTTTAGLTPGITRGLPRAFWIYMSAAGLLAAGFVDFPLIAFHFNTTALAPPAEIPLFYAAAMGVEAFAALFFGKLFDRVGMPVLLVGVLFSAASSPLVFFGSFYAALAGMALWGAGRGAQQSVLRAKIADLVPAERRGAAYGIFNTAYGILWFAGSSAIGILYGRSLASAVTFAVVTQLAAIPLLLMVGRRPT